MFALDPELIEGFVRGFLIKRFDKPTDIPAAHKEWWGLCCEVQKYVAIAAPRGHAKSTAITHSYVLANVLFRAKDFVILVSDTETQAVQFLNDIKMELTDNEELKALFQIDSFPKFTESDVIVKFKDGKLFRILAKGSEQSLRGLKWAGKRPNLILCDDMENDELVMNKERREKFMRWIYGALIPALAPEGLMRVVGTVLHLDSFLEQVMPKTWDRKTIREPLKDWSESKKGMWKGVRYRAHTDDFSDILWPQRFSKDLLSTIRADYTERGIPDVYSQEYLNYPLDPTRAYFRQNDFVAMTEKDKTEIDEQRRPLTYYVSCDPAISQTERADYTTYIVCGMDSNRILYMIEGIRDRLDGREQVDMILSLYKKYRPEFIAIEKDKITKAIGPFLREAMFEKNLFPYMLEIQPSKDLEYRAKSWQARVRVGGVKFDKAAEWYPQYEAELRTFPRGTKDDYVSASAVMGLALDRMIEAPTLREERDSAWEDERSRTIDADQGRSQLTGY